MQINALWSKWVDTITTKINNITDVIVHKEFPKAALLELCNEHGMIVINSWQQNSIAIEVITSCPQTSHKDIKVQMELVEDIIKIHTTFLDPKIKGMVIFNILLPKDVAVSIMTKQGDIVIKDLNSNLHLETLQGDIKLINPHQTVQAKTALGNIFIRTDSIQATEKFDLTSDKGNIEFYTTDIINCSLHAYALQGKVISEIPITLDSQTTLLNPEIWKNFKQVVHGRIGTAISHVNILAHYGSISILPYMKQNDLF